MARIAWVIFAVAAAMSGSVFAQAGLPEKLKACSAIADDAQRLSCYDQSVASLDAEAAKMATQRKALAETRAREAAAKAEADRKTAEAQAAQAKTDAFGAVGLPDDKRPAAKTESIDELESTIDEIFYSPTKEIILVLENGQMWRQTDQSPVGAVRKGDKVIIKKKTISGFRLSLVRQKRAIDVRRYR